MRASPSPPRSCTRPCTRRRRGAAAAAAAEAAAERLRAENGEAKAAMEALEARVTRLSDALEDRAEEVSALQQERMRLVATIDTLHLSPPQARRRRAATPALCRTPNG